MCLNLYFQVFVIENWIDINCGQVSIDWGLGVGFCFVVQYFVVVGIFYCCLVYVGVVLDSVVWLNYVFIQVVGNQQIGGCVYCLWGDGDVRVEIWC